MRNKVGTGCALLVGMLAMYSCSDTWDNHYEDAPVLTFNGNIMQALEQEAPDFAKVVKAYGFDKELSSDNIYTVWAPADGTFTLDDYVTSDGERAADSATVVNEFIKNQVARYHWSLDGTDHKFPLMNEKVGKMRASGRFGGSSMLTDEDGAQIDATAHNIACGNGILHRVGATNPYHANLLEHIKKLYEADMTAGKEDCSLYTFLKSFNADTLIESKSVNRGVNENGEKIWVYRYMEPNNTYLKNVDAKLYEEDSSFLAIIPSTEAYTKRYNKAASLLKFNPSETFGDSLQNYHANAFASADLFFNQKYNRKQGTNADLQEGETYELSADSLRSTQYRLYGAPWVDHIYYRKNPRVLPEDGVVNDILAKLEATGHKTECSNGVAYEVDEYPMTATEQFFKRIDVEATSGNVNILGGDDLTYTKNVGKGPFTPNRLTWTYTIIDEVDGEGQILAAHDTIVYYRWLDFQEVSPSGISVGFNVPNTLSGKYDIYLITSPIWIKDLLLDTKLENMDQWTNKGYRFRVYVWEKNNDPDNKDTLGKFPTDDDEATQMTNPNPPENDKTIYRVEKRYTTDEGLWAFRDTTYLGQHEFKNAYYGLGAGNYGAIIQIRSVATTTIQKRNYSYGMLISGLILKPHDEDDEPDAAKARTTHKLITSNSYK